MRRADARLATPVGGRDRRVPVGVQKLAGGALNAELAERRQRALVQHSSLANRRTRRQRKPQHLPSRGLPAPRRQGLRESRQRLAERRPPGVPVLIPKPVTHFHSGADSVLTPKSA